jgi:hypothetical protein
VVVGSVVGIGGWLAAAFVGVPADLTSGASPGAVLARDRSVLWTRVLTGLTLGPTVGLAVGVSEGV